jgi:hypothetical protein
MEQNYFEIVAVPVLQRKCQELFNSNMVLETNLHIEITKSRHALEQLEKLKTSPSSAESSSQELRSMQSTAASALSDASIYKNKYDQVRKELDCALEEIRALQACIPSQIDDIRVEKKAKESKVKKPLKETLVDTNEY